MNKKQTALLFLLHPSAFILFYRTGVKMLGVSKVTPKVTPERWLKSVNPAMPAKSKRKFEALN